MDAHKIILGVVIVILIYLLYLYFFGDSGAVLEGMHDASVESIIPASSVTPAVGSSNYTYSIWVYVSNWNAGAEKIIFERPGDDSGSFAPRVAFARDLNNVNISLATFDSTNPIMCQIESVPLQAWTNIIITINGQALDLYLDGKLVRTCVMNGVPKPSSQNLVLTPKGRSFQGYTSNFRYINKNVNPREAYAIYKEGYQTGNWLSSMFNKYRIKLAFLEDNVEVNSFEI